MELLKESDEDDDPPDERRELVVAGVIIALDVNEDNDELVTAIDETAALLATSGLDDTIMLETPGVIVEAPGNIVEDESIAADDE